MKNFTIQDVTDAILKDGAKLYHNHGSVWKYYWLEYPDGKTHYKIRKGAASKVFSKLRHKLVIVNVYNGTFYAYKVN